ncbi:MAG TPA: hypothetical protein VHO25_17870 [Polyangiaceae bacterium]|nr:hypothetical protein [Polyangiaceae bacterium]
MRNWIATISVSSLVCLALTACGDDDDDRPGTDAQQHGVGAECTQDEHCLQEGILSADGGNMPLDCLTTFKGGYCGLQNCGGDADCPQGSACVAHDDGENYCFLICANKPECNLYRSLENESNCSSNADFVDGTQGRKACVPPSSGI